MLTPKDYPDNIEEIQDLLALYFWYVIAKNHIMIDAIFDEISECNYHNFRLAIALVNDISHRYDLNPYTFLIINRSLLVENFNSKLYDVAILYEYSIRMDKKFKNYAREIIDDYGTPSTQYELEMFLSQCNPKVGLTREAARIFGSIVHGEGTESSL